MVSISRPLISHTSSVHLFFGILLLVTGCGSTIVPSSGPRPASDPAQVKIYQKEPARYERLTDIWLPIMPGAKWDDRGEANAGFDRFKAVAAEKGANGLLLSVNSSEYDTLVTVGYKGTFYQVPIQNNPRTAKAVAIYVLKE